MQATADRILDIAEQFVQLRGFNGFSYADVAERLEVSKPSIHYHFASKAVLGRRLIERYRARFNVVLAEIAATEPKSAVRLERYASLYAGVLRDRTRMCLCGMMAAEYMTLPEPLRVEIIGFFDDNEAWLAHVLDEGRKSGELDFDGTPELKGRLLLSSLEGAMLVARSYEDVERFERIAARLLLDLTPTSQKTKQKKKKLTLKKTSKSKGRAKKR